MKMNPYGRFHVEWHDELDSTNSYALELAGNRELELPRVICAKRQRAGRGRGQNAWWSSDGALTMSLLFDPLDYHLPQLRWPQVALTTGLAIADVLEQHLPPASVQLKWPNDVYASGRKICGILTEVPPGAGNRLVVGIGLNAANTLAHAPPEIQKQATALCDLIGSAEPSIEELLAAILAAWDRWLKRLAADEIDFSMLWRSKCYLTGARVSVTVEPVVQTGICLGLDTDGALLLDTGAGTVRILAGTVRKLLG